MSRSDTMAIREYQSTTTLISSPGVPAEEQRPEPGGERLLDAQAAYIDQSGVDTLAGITTTAIYEGALLGGGQELLLGEALLSEPDARTSLTATGQNGLLEGIVPTLSALERRELLARIEEADILADIELALPLASSILSSGLDLLTELDLRAEETSDVMEAAAEGYTYVPPIDPPVVPGSCGSWANAEIASGLGLSALDEPYDEEHHSSFLAGDDEVSTRVREALRADSSTTAYADRIAITTHGGIAILHGVVDDLIDNDNLLAVASYVAGVHDVVDALRVRGM
jgi:hypothetical protein